MLKIDNNLLEQIGLAGLPDSEKNSLLKHIYETLEMRVGMRLADQMTNEQLDEFERYFEAKDDAGAFKWLETNFPNYKDIVQEEFEKLKAEVGQAAPQILAASQQAQLQAQSQPQPVPQPPQMPQQYAPPAAAAQPQPAPIPQQPLPNYAQPAPEQSYAPPVQQTPAPAQPYAAPAQPQQYPDYPQQQPPAGPTQ